MGAKPSGGVISREEGCWGLLLFIWRAVDVASLNATSCGTDLPIALTEKRDSDCCRGYLSGSGDDASGCVEAGGILNGRVGIAI